MSEIQELDVDEDKVKFVMNRRNVKAAPPNSLMVSNTEEGYKNYFNLGGTVGKMTTQTAINYMKFK